MKYYWVMIREYDECTFLDSCVSLEKAMERGYANSDANMIYEITDGRPTACYERIPALREMVLPGSDDWGTMPYRDGKVIEAAKWGERRAWETGENIYL